MVQEAKSTVGIREMSPFGFLVGNAGNTGKRQALVAFLLTCLPGP
jgi:hypothetical protein